MQPCWMKLKRISIKEERVLVQYKSELQCDASEYFMHISLSISTVHLFGWQTLRIQKSCQVRKSLTPAGKQVCAQKRKLEIQEANADQIHLKSSKWCLLVVPGCCLSPKKVPRTSRAIWQTIPDSHFPQSSIFTLTPCIWTRLLEITMS